MNSQPDEGLPILMKTHCKVGAHVFYRGPPGVVSIGGIAVSDRFGFCHCGLTVWDHGHAFEGGVKEAAE